MATFGPEKAPYRNADGLVVYYGPQEGVSGTGGEYRTLEANRSQEVIIDLATMTTSAQSWDRHFAIPKGAFIERVDVEVLVAATSSGSGTLNVGLIQSDGTTNISDTALVAAAAVATLAAAGNKLTLIKGATAAGANVGTALAANGTVTAKAGTAVFQTGRIAVRAFYNYLPLV